MASHIILKKEFTKMVKRPPSEYFIVQGLVDDNLQLWEIYIVGPPGTYYENGVYRAYLKFPDDYPMKPPTLQFKSKIFHPNIYLDGKVCISTLQIGQDGKDMGQYWRPVLGIEQAVLSVISLFDDPNIDDPANTAAAHMYKKDRRVFKQKCHEIAVESLKNLPEDFEHPSEIYKRIQASEEKEKEKAMEESEEIHIIPNDDDWVYDVEDVSDDEEDYDDGELSEEIKVEPNSNMAEEIVEIDDDEEVQHLKDRFHRLDQINGFYFPPSILSSKQLTISSGTLPELRNGGAQAGLFKPLRKRRRFTSIFWILSKSKTLIKKAIRRDVS